MGVVIILKYYIMSADVNAVPLTRKIYAYCKD